MVDYEYDCLIGGDARVTIAKKLPGYWCDQCQADYHDGTLDALFLNIVAEATTALGDTTLAETLRRQESNPREYTVSSPFPTASDKQVPSL